ncbi:copper-binding protein [Ramlibacter sp.]|uniref:copper-binding protein n=1 Tax=Ramlibacter sp. TaxID=1917967 RepID=UPI002C8FB0BA|nr:copper-binding protein [Ramlibacter sp.]HWI83689.1 copper-binding protein [Ramlibacter sp.]
MQIVRAIACAALLGCATCVAALAQSAAPAAAKTEADAAALTQGEVRKIDQENRKITLKHEAIKNLDMPPMTMVFQVRDPALLGKVQVGDVIRFAAISEGGKLTVTRIEPAR